MEKSIKIAFLGNCTIDYIAQSVKNACADYDITANIYLCAYDQYRQDILDQNSKFYEFNPDITFMPLESQHFLHNWYEFNTLVKDPQTKKQFIQSAFENIIELIERIHLCCSTKIVLNNFRIPYHSPLGILDNKYYPGLKDMLCLLNIKLSEWSNDKDYIYMFDYNGLAAQYGNENIDDPKMYYLAKIPTSLRFTNKLAGEYMRIILPMKGKNKKCLVLDLDNTLWGGVIGEAGMAGIQLDVTGAGKSFYDFQKEILNLYAKGIILAVCSKNNMDDALDVIENHPHMLLRKHYFSCLKINWQDKVQNIKEIARELNICTDSMVFFDDNPVERDFVKSMLPMVDVINVPEDVSKYTNTLKNKIEFELIGLTAEDLKRNNMYSENQKRQEYMQKFNDLDDYLSSLQTKIILKYAEDFSIPRIAQLTQKTNQFNMTTKRYTQTGIEDMAKDDSYLIFSCEVQDKFGDNGITGVCIIKRDNKSAEIDTFLLSCRVMGRNIEYVFLNKIVSILKEKGITNISAQYTKTQKNKVVKDFYALAGFTEQSVEENQIIYTFDFKNKLKNISYIEILFENEV